MGLGKRQGWAYARGGVSQGASLGRSDVPKCLKSSVRLVSQADC